METIAIFSGVAALFVAIVLFIFLSEREERVCLKERVGIILYSAVFSLAVGFPLFFMICHTFLED